MRILAFVDTHGNERQHDRLIEQSRYADLIICAGDFTVFENDMDNILRRFNSIGKPFLLIHGNHESASSAMASSINFPNIHFIHKNYFIKDDLIFFGYGGGGFSIIDHKFDIVLNNFLDEWPSLEKKHGKALRLVLITHAPPYGTNLDDLGEHVGNQNIAEFIRKHQPILALAGHIHECSGAEDMINKTRLMNPGPHGILFEI